MGERSIARTEMVRVSSSSRSLPSQPRALAPLAERRGQAVISASHLDSAMSRNPVSPHSGLLPPVVSRPLL